MNKTTKIKQVLLPATLSSFSFACSQNSHLELLEEETIKAEINGFQFEYEYAVPGAYLTYNYLWDGVSLQDSQTEVVRYYFSFLTEYKESKNTYYLAYLKQSKISEYKSYLKDYEQKNNHQDQNYHFISYDNEKVIDGKYYFARQKLAKEDNNDIIYYSSKNIKDIVYKIGDYQLVFACLNKKAIIKKNLSKDETIDKEINLYRRVELSFDNEKSSPKEYIFDTREKYNQAKIKRDFDYIGEKIEVYPESYKEKEYGSFPILGMENNNIDSVRANVIKEKEDTYILLPRYMKSNGTKVDLLDEEVVLQPNEDVFGKHKKEFRDAFRKEYNELEGLFDYSKVIEIMKIK